MLHSKQSRRRGPTITIAVSAIALLALAACSSNGTASDQTTGSPTNSSAAVGTESGSQAMSSPESTQSAPATVIQVQGYGGSETDLPMFVAMAKGFDTAHNIKIKLTSLESGTSATAAVVGGSIQIAATALSNPMAVDSKGGHLQAISGLLPNNIFSLIVPAGSPAIGQSYPALMKTFVGQPVGVSSLGGSTDLMFRALLKDAGVNLDDVKFTAVGAVNTGYAAIKQKRVAAYMGYDPLPAICELTKTCATVIDLGAGQGAKSLTALNGAFQVYFTSQEYINSNRDAVQGFVDTVEETMKWMKDPANLDEVVKIAQDNMQLGVADSNQVIAKMVKDGVNRFNYSVDRNAADAWSKFMVDTGQIAKPVPAADIVWEGAPKPAE